MKLSKYFTLYELTYSPTALRRGIDNTPSSAVKENLSVLCKKILDPVRDLIGKPIQINSGFRCRLLNTIVGGSVNSQHVYGQAADIECRGVSADTLYQMIKTSNIPFHELIQEYNSWVHISFSRDPKRKCFYATKINGKTVYTRDA